MLAIPETAKKNALVILARFCHLGKKSGINPANNAENNVISNNTIK